MPSTPHEASTVWHPYTQHATAPEPEMVIRAQGSRLILEDGREILDAISSWWVNLHGHSHPHIGQSIARALGEMQQVLFAGYTHPRAVELSGRILGLFDGHFGRSFFSDNGSTSVEVALKMCFQHWSNQGSARRKIIAFRGAYHGDTFGAMAVGERGVFTKPFWPHLFEVEFIDPPLLGDHSGRTRRELQELLGRCGPEVAGIIIEPLVQGAGGMLMQDLDELDEILSLVRAAGGLIIADEVMTGFGRTGRLFASQALRELPDILCLSKGLTGGCLPLGLTLATMPVYEAFLSSEKGKALLHGHSFTGNVLSCAAALASLELLLEAGCQERIQWLTREHWSFSSLLRSVPLPLKDIRACGTILALEVDVPGEPGYLNPTGERMRLHFQGKGILIRPLGNVLYLMPPYCFTEAQLDRTYSEILSYLRDHL